MRIANRVGKVKLIADVLVAGVVCTVAVCVLAATPSFAQDQGARSGVSHPPAASSITADEDSGVATAAPAAPAAKPSAAIPAPASEAVYGPYVPYQAPGTPAAAPAQSADVSNPDATIVNSATAGQDDRLLASATQTAAAKADPDAGIVMHVSSRPGEISDGTLVKVKLREDLSTLTTRPGTRFTAEVSEPVMKDGKVIVPVGSVLDGRVTWVRGGKRIGGPAAIHLEPRTITLPDGTEYMLRAQAIDTDHWDAMKVDGEGTIERMEHGKRTAAMVSLSAGSGLAAGAMIGGVPGAVIGAGVGAGVSTVVWLKEDRQAELPKDMGVVFSLTEPMSITPVSAAVAPVKGGAPGGE